jgi:antitoxin (DNA-binding transcriptional repressor) of toxin-antitoxin stability system
MRSSTCVTCNLFSASPWYGFSARRVSFVAGTISYSVGQPMTKRRICVSEAEAVRDFGSVLAHVRAGSEVIIRTKGRPIAIVSPVEPRKGRSLLECIGLLRDDSTAIMDADFARDVNDAIKGHSEPFDPPEWD